VDNVAVKDKERATTLHVEFQIHRTPVIFPPTVDLAALRAASKKTAHEESQDSAKMRIIKLQIEEIMKKGMCRSATPACDFLSLCSSCLLLANDGWMDGWKEGHPQLCLI